MKKKTKILIYVITFIVVFLISALIRIMLLGSAPERLIKVSGVESPLIDSLIIPAQEVQ